MFGPLMHTVKLLEAESIIPGHCTGTVKRKLIKTQLQWYIGQFLRARAGPGRLLGLTHHRHRVIGCWQGSGRRRLAAFAPPRILPLLTKASPSRNIDPNPHGITKYRTGAVTAKGTGPQDRIGPSRRGRDSTHRRPCGTSPQSGDSV